MKLSLLISYLILRLVVSSSSLSCIWTGGSTTMRFQGTKTVRVSGRNGERWNCKVTAPPPLTKTSNLQERVRERETE